MTNSPAHEAYEADDADDAHGADVPHEADEAHGAYGGFRTGGLWAVAAIAFAAVVVGSAVALFGMLEFDERCSHGMITGPGSFQRARYESYPPATVCEFSGGEVASVGGSGVLFVLLWVGMAVLVGCLLLALVAEWFEPRTGGELVVPRSRAERVRRTATAFFVTGSVFLGFYVLIGRPLFAGPSSACSASADWGSQPPRTLEYSLFPPQATCQYTSGMTEQLNPGWATALSVQLAVPALLAGIGFALALRRRCEERRGASPA
ncbi:hypothetical protein [Streptomyces luteolus]|uniref:Integral membrane protein n=1 Tax=Streptomyces luteolus TaxID=3043615 RepID=A0ABT6T6A4_9ACTN|nr:hypothetical protein [Streptomyces sp. B-S-A12]MDI3422574.1 hypothetical protein [Streptomyces sp. B-S-A12]